MISDLDKRCIRLESWRIKDVEMFNCRISFTITKPYPEAFMFLRKNCSTAST